MKPIKGNVYRELLARAIEANGGYSSGYWDRYALSWDVSLDFGVPDSRDLCKGGSGPNWWPDAPAFEALKENWGVTFEQFTNAVPLKRMLEWCDEWDEDESQQRIWNWVQEDMARSIDEGDDEGVLSVRPEVAARYGLPGSEAKLHSGKRYDKEHKYREGAWDHAPKFKVEFERAGRGGKHLGLVSFEGYTLKVRGESMVEALREEDSYRSEHHYTDAWCQKLVAYIAECDLMFSREAVKAEFMYQVNFRAADELHDLYEAGVAEAKEAAERAYWAERDVVTQ